MNKSTDASVCLMYNPMFEIYMIVIMFQLLIIYILLKDKIINTNDDDEPIIFNNICRAIKKWKEM